VRILHVEHPDGAGPGVFADVAPLETWRAWETPPPAGDVDVIVLYGGATNVADGHDWMDAELDWLRGHLEAGTPVFGVCLGAQLLANALGAEVTRTTPEIGWHPVELTDAGAQDPVLGALPHRFEACQWHSWQVALPDGATLLARSPSGIQAFRHGRSVGVQFHPEVDRPTLARWIEHFDTDPDAVAQGYDPTVELPRMQERIASWNELGRTLFAAFLRDVT
jgi:GMP synthase (glutamine-hydrolysing)